MAPISQEPEQFEYIVIGGGSGGSGTVRPLYFPLRYEKGDGVRGADDLSMVGQKSSRLVWQEDAFD